jgi:hypothetical protein
MPVETWTAKGQDPSIRHIGPMAQDFAAAFGLGEDDTHIATIDAEGVALAAIQGLYQVVQDKQAETSALHADNAALVERVTTLEARLASVEQALGMRNVAAAPLEASFGGGWPLVAGLALAGVGWGRRRLDKPASGNRRFE